MKAILCGKCMDIRALNRTANDPVTCRCGNVKGWWIDPIRGTMKVYAIEREYAKVIGIHNDFLTFAFEHNPLNLDWGNNKWKEHTTAICQAANGYVFHESLRNCPVAIIGIGITKDISFELEEDKVPVDAIKDEPITKEWLKSVASGFWENFATRIDTEKMEMTAGDVFDLDWLVITAVEGEYQCKVNDHVIDLKFRSDVQKLCNVLGIMLRKGD